jgi:hypothetical protein
MTTILPNSRIQLAEQTKVTPWELPYEELLVGLAGQQTAYDKKIEDLSGIDYGTGGLFTQEASEGLKQKYDPTVQSYLEKLKKDPYSVSTGEIKALSKKIVEDEAYKTMEYDVKYTTPEYLKKQSTGDNFHGINMFVDKDGKPIQVHNLTDLSTLEFVPHQNVMGDFSDFAQKYITPFTDHLTKTGVTITEDPLVPGRYVYSEKSETGEVKRLSPEDVAKRMFNHTGFSGDGKTFLQAYFDENSKDVNFYKLKFQRENDGVAPTLEDYKRDVAIPAARLLMFNNISRKESEIPINQPGDGGSKRGGGGDTPSDPTDDLTFNQISYFIRMEEVMELLGVNDPNEKVTVQKVSNAVNKKEELWKTSYNNNKQVLSNVRARFEDSEDEIFKKNPTLAKYREAIEFDMDETGAISIGVKAGQKPDTDLNKLIANIQSNPSQYLGVDINMLNSTAVNNRSRFEQIQALQNEFIQFSHLGGRITAQEEANKAAITAEQEKIYGFNPFEVGGRDIVNVGTVKEPKWVDLVDLIPNFHDKVANDPRTFWEKYSSPLTSEEYVLTEYFKSIGRDDMVNRIWNKNTGSSSSQLYLPADKTTQIMLGANYDLARANKKIYDNLTPTEKDNYEKLTAASIATKMVATPAISFKLNDINAKNPNYSARSKFIAGFVGTVMARLDMNPTASNIIMNSTGSPLSEKQLEY